MPNFLKKVADPMGFWWKDDAGKPLRQAVEMYDQIDVPTIEEQMLELAPYIEAGQLSPEQARAYLVEQNAVDDMELDTEGKQAQLSALSQLSEIGNEGGLTASDKSKLSAIANEESTQSRGAREAILQNAQARGAGGSGLEMLAQLQNAQEAATRKSTRDLGVAGMAQERALQALQSAGQLGGNINQQQFSQQKSIADTKNEIAKFNTQNQQQVGLANTAANNTAQSVNLANKQNTMNANVGLKNDQQQHNKGLAQQKFGNQLDISSAKGNALAGVSNQINKDAADQKEKMGTVASVAAMAFSDERAKEDVKGFDAGQFLDSLTGYKYKYKDPGMGEGKQVGVMAQDIEKHAPQMVEDTEQGKMVDYSPKQAGGPIFASLADLNERLRRMEGK